MSKRLRMTGMPFAALLVLASIATTFGKAQEKNTEQPATIVRMTADNRFVPETVTITAGQTVEWVTVGEGIHTVVADPDLAQYPRMVQLPKGVKPFHSAAITPGRSFKHRFTVPGTYRYICTPHQPQMTGRVIVKPKDE